MKRKEYIKTLKNDVFINCTMCLGTTDNETTRFVNDGVLKCLEGDRRYQTFENNEVLSIQH